MILRRLPGPGAGRTGKGYGVTTSAPNIVLVMSDQHRADMMGCAGDASVLTPSLDALASEGVRFSRVSCQGPLCMPSRASFMTERYVRDHGVYTNWARSRRTARPMRGPCERPGTTRRSWARRTCTSTRTSPSRTSTTWPDVSRRWDSPRSSRRATSSSARSRTATRTIWPDESLLDDYKKHIADRSYQGENEDGQNATKCVPMWDSTPMPLPLEAYVDTWHGLEAVRWIERYDRQEPFFLFVGFPGPHDPWDAPEEAVQRYRDVDISMPHSTRRPTVEGTGRYSALLNSFLWVSDSETMTDDAIRGMRRLLCRRHIGHRPRGRPHGRCARAQGPPGLHVDHVHE